MSETTRTYRSPMPVPVDTLMAWHASPGAFDRLTPPWMPVRVLQDEGIAAGSVAKIKVPVAGPLGFTWTLVHENREEGIGFVDVQQSGPFSSWRHEHRFEPDGADRSILEDHLEYTLPMGGVGQSLAGERISGQLEELFHFRHLQTRIDLTRYAAANLPPRHIAITGASGLVGRRLVAFLQGGGHRVSRLVRSAPKGSDEIYWNPATGEIDAAALEGVDAVIHLAGVSIAGRPWTASRKKAIRDSRIEGTTLIAKTIAGLQRKPAVFVSTSAVGYYGDGGSDILTEVSPSGNGFLADVCRDWEDAARPAAAAGIRVVHPRFGVVMAGEGGMLPLLARVFRMGVGGPLGDGQQYLAWIALDDLLGVLLESISNDALEGPVNAVAPETTTNNDFTRAMGSVLRRPTILRAPAFAIRTVAGEQATELILVSQRVLPQRLEEVGFQFAFPTLESALRFELGRNRGGVEAGIPPLLEGA